MSSQRTLMCKDLLEAATYGRENTLTQLLGLNGGGSPDSTHVTIEASNNAPNQTQNFQSATFMGNTVLHILASNGHAELAQKTYMKDRSLLEVCNKGGDTALHCAARYGHSGVISLLVDKAHELQHNLEDTLRKKNKHEETALHEAARYGCEATVQVLITEDVQLAGEVNKNNESPLYLATIEGHFDVVRLIVQHLCNREITFAYYSGPRRMTALHAAVLRSTKELQSYIWYIRWYGIRLNFFKRPQRKQTGLDMANELLKLDRGSLAKRGDILESTPLHYAASIEAYSMARRLLNHDASLAYCNDSLGLSPVHVAALKGHLKMVVEFLQNNLDSWELLDHRGRNFFHVGAEMPNNIIKQLLKIAGKARSTWPELREVLCKASFTRDNDGTTPLQIAARGGHRRTLRALLRKEWVDFTLTSLDNLAFSYDQSNPQVSQSATDESYEKIYQHYKNLDQVVEAAKYPKNWLHIYSKEQDPPESSDALATKIQTIALGSVLIATVTFAAAFTPPGGYNSTDGTPVLGKKYAFRAFILADVVAFVSSFLSTFFLIHLGTDHSGSFLKRKLATPRLLFATATVCMVLAFALGLYVVLAPIRKLFSIIVLLTALTAAIQYRYSKNSLRWGPHRVAPYIVIVLVALINK
ncbi:Ankyrin repeat protein family-like protein [Rhynchospora pubera]|uniref:Ankyrin repeat protein family-like protein n=1 Tax=Rhynchospora pubera TaxID=906938 RepID=A0AAV8D213_9POAL|nr:Ankyrin repeat protein family-like protein [Rhynchospora pubera]